MRLEHYIGNLLYRYDCVIVPKFGAFITQSYSSDFDSDNRSIIYPPTKNVSFNSLLTRDDGILINAISVAEGISYEEASQKVDFSVSFWKSHIESYKVLILDGIGEIERNKLNKLVFSPNKNNNFSLDSYGLDAIRTKYVLPREKAISPERKSGFSWLRAASIVPILLGGFIYFQSPKVVEDFVGEQWSGFVMPFLENNSGLQIKDNVIEIKPEEKIINQEESIQKEIKETLIKDETSEEIVEEEFKFHVIGGSFKSKERADNMKEILISEGYEKAQQIIKKENNYYLVTYESFADEKEAHGLKNQLIEEGKDAWVFEEK